jgi:hypothetical protein
VWFRTMSSNNNLSAPQESLRNVKDFPPSHGLMHWRTVRKLLVCQGVVEKARCEELPTTIWFLHPEKCQACEGLPTGMQTTSLSEIYDFVPVYCTCCPGINNSRSNP